MQKSTIPLVINKDRVFIIKDSINKKNLVVKLVNAVCDDLPALNRDDIMAAILKREQGISTTLDSGLSIPHARIDDLTTFQAAAAVLPEGISDDYGLRIKVMLLFLSPSGQAYFSQHLKLLAALAEQFNTAFIDTLCACKNEEEILKTLSF